MESGTAPGLAELSTLEEKVDRVAGMLEKQQARNRELTSEIEDLRERLSVREITVEELQRELEDARKHRRDPAKEELIRGKLTTLLSRIESLEQETA
ncbi:hypothetical protein KQI52_04340 [bacterium]|nr:hypothetical protein [bacterium]